MDRNSNNTNINMPDFELVASSVSWQRCWYVALGISLAVHMGTLALLTLWGLAPVAMISTVNLDSRWEESATDPEPFVLDTKLPEFANPEQTNQLSTQSSLFAMTSSAHTTQRVVTPTPTQAVPVTDGISKNELATNLGSSMAIHSGTGDAEGSGDGKGFFGADLQGKSVVFVVDRSKSMNHPHPSKAKTRFKRLKLEILKSVGNLNAESSFFIIFFNDRAWPMPARTMQPALAEYQKHYLTWMTNVRAEGNTDPREALQMALKLRPDVIYFLTDGSFEFRVNKTLEGIQQSQTSIHTFAFGETEAEKTLKILANHNNGKYHFVP